MPQQAIPLVRAAALAPFVDFLDEIGTPCERLLEDAGLSADMLTRAGSLVPLHKALRFVDAAARREGIQHLGLVVGQRTPILDYKALGGLLSSSMTLGKAIDLLVENIKCFNSSQRLSLRRRGGDALFCHRMASGPNRHGELFTLLLMIDVIRLAAGPRWHPQAIFAPAWEASECKAYEAVLKLRCHVGTNCWIVVFDEVLLGEQLRYCTKACDVSAAGNLNRLRAAAPADDFTGSLRQVVAALLPRGTPHIGVAAEAGGLSVRTLQRRLTEAGYTYSRLVDEARLESARRLLREPDVKIVDVAFELGYSDAANFSRAFRRWTGTAPRTARGSRADDETTPKRMLT